MFRENRYLPAHGLWPEGQAPTPASRAPGSGSSPLEERKAMCHLSATSSSPPVEGE